MKYILTMEKNKNVNIIYNRECLALKTIEMLSRITMVS